MHNVTPIFSSVSGNHVQHGALLCSHWTRTPEPILSNQSLLCQVKNCIWILEPGTVFTWIFVGSLYDSSLAVWSFSLIQASISSTSRLNCWSVWDSPSFDLFSIIWAFRRRHLYAIKYRYGIKTSTEHGVTFNSYKTLPKCVLFLLVSASRLRGQHWPVQHLVAPVRNDAFGVMVGRDQLVSKGLQDSNLLFLLKTGAYIRTVVPWSDEQGLEWNKTSSLL